MASKPTKKSQVASLGDFSREELSFLLENLDKMPLSEQEFLLKALEGDAETDRVVECQENFMSYMKTMEPKYIYGAHHRRIASVLEEVVRGEKTRVIINIAPRFGKSELASYLFPSWFIGKFPDQKIIIASHTAELATNFGRKVRNLMDTPEYRDVFPDVRLSVDSKAAGRWATNEGGEFFAAGVGGALAGRGAHLCLVPECLVVTDRGEIQAKDVLITDRLLGRKGWVDIRHKILATHCETVCINDKVRVSAQHPMWVVGKGWVSAGDVYIGDVLLSVSLFGRLRIVVKQGECHARNAIKATRKRIQHLVHDAPAVSEREGQKLSAVWWSRDFCMRAVGKIRRVLRRYGAGSEQEAHVGSQGQRRGLHARELPVGGSANAAEQQVEHGVDNRVRRDAICDAVVQEDRAVARPDHSQDKCDADATGRSAVGREDVLDTARGDSADAGGCGSGQVYKLRGSEKGVWKRLCVERVKWALSYSTWFPVEVRRVDIEIHEPRLFVNFHVGGDNTFVCGSSLCHNCIVDDPISEQQAKSGSTQAFIDQWEWFQQGLMTRLMPGGKLVILMTRWSRLDLCGQILNHMAKNPDAEQWEVIELPAVLPSGESLWPEFWPTAELEKKRIAVGPAAWAAQYLQQPTSEGAQILKSEWWRNWDKDEPPECVYTVMSLDAAQEAHNRADYSAMTLWGVFYVDGADGRKMTNVILLNAWKDRLEFPDLKRAVLADYKEWKPDTFIIEKKSNGAALYQELRRMDIAVTEYTPVRGTASSPQHKVARVNAISDMFASGMIWAPLDRRWAQEVVMECAEFPLGETDDYVDATTISLMRIRQGGFLTLPSDCEDNELPEFRRTNRSYY